MKNILFFTIILGMLFTAYPVEAVVDYQLWANVLGKYVDENGLVNYEGLLQDRADFDKFMDQIETADISGLSDIEKKAFWINAYNAITVDVILKKYPVKSIRRINFGLVWEVPRRAAGKRRSLGHIEHKIIRPLGDPRIHFAINCASIGCPKLPNKPFYPETLDAQLEAETKRFINDTEKIRLDRSTNTLYHSAILSWFEEDFLVTDPDLLSYIKRYINPDDLAYLNQNEVKLKKAKYDWGLNKQ